MSDLDLIKKTGEGLYGPNYQQSLAAALGYKSGKSIRKWLTSESPTPADLRPRLAALVESRVKILNDLLHELYG